MGFDQNGWVGLTIEASPDNATWTTVVDVVTTEKYTKSYPLATPTDVRYIRVTDQNGGFGLNYEISIFAVPVPLPPSGTMIKIR
jgi:hypothetical protein